MQSPLELSLVLIAAALVAIVGSVLVARRRRSADAARAYLQGFRYILSDEPDQALEQLTRAAEVDARTFETYLALGALFRRTGEFERAIRLHQNMLLRKELDPAVRQQVQLELALDYHRAGMFERAVEAYGEVLKGRPDHKEALIRLRQVLEERKDYAQAAEAQRRLVEAGEGTRTVLAHLLAEAALHEADPELARRFAEKAADIDASSGHAFYALGLIAQRQGRAKEAREALRTACALEPELAARASELLAPVDPRDAARFFSDRIAQAGDHPALRLALARAQRLAGEPEQAIANLRRALELDGRYVAARVELGRTLLESNMSEGVRREIEGLLAVLGGQAPSFVCKACGHGFPEAQWRCPRCLGWDTVHRATSVEPPAAEPGRTPPAAAHS